MAKEIDEILHPMGPVGPVPEDKPKPHVAHNSGDMEWYTPAEIVNAVKGVFGQIDLDPASTPEANKTIFAKNYYTVNENGLAMPWNGRVYLNPPYARGLVGQFVAKLISEYEIGNTTQAIALLNNATDTLWFNDLVQVCSAVCFPTGRIKFLKEDGSKGAPLQGQVLVYLGKYPVRFINVFSAIGQGFIPLR